MTAILKPTQARLKGAWVVNSAVAGFGDGKTNLFDNVRGAWNATTTFYWNGTSTYIDITLHQKSAIWILPNAVYLQYSDGLNVSKWNDSLSIFEFLVKTKSRTTSDSWEMMIELEAGRYKFAYGGALRMDDEWFIENITINRLILKNQNTNQYYSLAEKTLIHLPSSSDKNMILHGVEAGKEIKLDEDFDKMKFVQDTSEALGNGKIFTHVVEMNNVKINKIIL